MQTSIEASPQQTQADLLRIHIEGAGLSQRGAARELGIDERSIRKYCSGGAPVPLFVMVNAARLALIANYERVLELIDSGQMSTSDGALTRDQFAAKIAVTKKAIAMLVGR